MKPKDVINEIFPGAADSLKQIPAELYQKFNVKRGLRNSDGTGVLVGLTEIGEVHGYIKSEEEKMPVDGILRYRGISINDLVSGFLAEKRFGFEETSFLLLFGYLPSPKELENFNKLLGEQRNLPTHFHEDSIMKFPSKNLMNKLARSILVLYSSDENPEDLSSNNVLLQCIRLLAQMPVLAAYAYQAKRYNYDRKSLYIHKPDPELSTAENFLMMLRPDKKYTQLEAELLDLALVLHAEHGGGNNSSFTTHVVTSSGTDTYSAISAAIGSLKGHLHGGANIMVLKMMENIKKNIENWDDEAEVAAYLEKILRKKVFDRKGLIYGIGHAVYTKSDPRAILLKSKADDLAREAGKEDEFRLYELIERITPEIFRKVKGNDKVLCANVDFYSGFVYSSMDIPPDLFTPIFAMARMAGWGAHRMEELTSGGRIVRPAYKSVATHSNYIPMNQRKEK